MSQYLKYNDPLKVIWRKGDETDPFPPISDTQKIINNTILLTEIPDEFNHVSISGYSEIFDNEPTTTQFKVNYSTGIVFFNSTEEGKTVTANYNGRGQIMSPASRVYIHNENPDVVETLQDMIDDGRVALDAIGDLQPTIDDAYVVRADLETTISTGDTLHTTLQDDISAGTNLDSQISTTIINANTAKSNLDTSIDNSQTAKANLDTTVSEAGDLNTSLSTLNDRIDVAETTKSNLDSSITNGNTVKTNLDNSITNANDINNTLSNTTNGTIKQATDINNSLFATTNTANTTKTNLDTSITNGNTTKSDLDNTIINASTINNTLSNTTDGTIKEASDINNTLNSTIDTANTTNTTLNSTIDTANTQKTNLDSSVSTANTTKTNLETTISTAQSTKNDLDTSIDTGDLANYIQKAEKGVASGVATLDTTGNIPSSQLSYVDTKATQTEQSANSYTDQQITLVTETGIPKLNIYEYKINADVDDSEFTIPLDTFDKTTDTVRLYINTTFKDSDFYTVINSVFENGILTENGKVVLNTPLLYPSRVVIEVLKNVPIGAEGSVSGTVLAPNTVDDTKIGERTIDDTFVPNTPDNGFITNIFNWFANRIKMITGKSSWKDAPTKNMEEINTTLNAHLNESVTDANGAHGLIVEDGTFTPVLSFGGASTGITYSRQAGRYRRIGNIVDIEIELKLTSKGTATGSAKITGLPFATPKDLPSTVNLNSTNSFLNWDAANGKNKIVVQLATYTSEIYPKIESINTGNDLLYDTNFNDITIFTINGTYHI